MPLTINELLDQGAEHARHVLIGEEGAAMIPTWHLQTPEGDPDIIVATPWNGDDEKEFMIFAMRRMLRDKKAESYSFVSEAWVAIEDARHPIGLMPREREDRREVVIINAYDRLGFGTMRVYEMKRNDKGVVTDLVMDPPMEGFEGRLANLFKDEDSHADS
jgi:hypothetical protein